MNFSQRYVKIIVHDTKASHSTDAKLQSVATKGKTLIMSQSYSCDLVHLDMVKITCSNSNPSKKHREGMEGALNMDVDSIKYFTVFLNTFDSETQTYLWLTMDGAKKRKSE